MEDGGIEDLLDRVDSLGSRWDVTLNESVVRASWRVISPVWGAAQGNNRGYGVREPIDITT